MAHEGRHWVGHVVLERAGLAVPRAAHVHGHPEVRPGEGAL